MKKIFKKVVIGGMVASLSLPLTVFTTPTSVSATEKESVKQQLIILSDVGLEREQYLFADMDWSTRTEQMISPPFTSPIRDKVFSHKNSKGEDVYWFKIDVGDERYWIATADFYTYHRDMPLEGGEDNIYLSDSIPIYTSFKEPREKSGSISQGQHLKIREVYGKYDGDVLVEKFYEIQTWLGIQYIKASDVNSDELPVKDEGQIYVIGKSDQKTSLLEKPYSNKNDIKISNQKVNTLKKMGDWYQIKTWVGPKWIKPDMIFNGQVDKFEKEIVVTDGTKLQSLPDFIDENEGALSGQNVKSLSYAYMPNTYSWEHDKQWYEIKTWKGKRWVSGESVAKEVELTATLKSPNKLYLYDSPTKASKREQYVGANQELKIKKVYGHWALIQTWLGDKWINGFDAKENVVTPHMNTKLFSGTHLLYGDLDLNNLTGNSITDQNMKVLFKVSYDEGDWYFVIFEDGTLGGFIFIANEGFVPEESISMQSVKKELKDSNIKQLVERLTK